MGAEVTTSDGHAPMTVVGRARLSPTAHHLPVASAQLLGAAVLAGLAADGETTVSSPGPTRDHTERMLAAAGIGIRREGSVTTVHGPARPAPLQVVVPGDSLSAAPWLVAAALHPDAEVTMTGVGLNPTRTALLDVLRRAGAEVETTVRERAIGRAGRRHPCPRWWTAGARDDRAGPMPRRSSTSCRCSGC